jgi:hypothetical protein
MTNVQFDEGQVGTQHYASLKIFGRRQTPSIVKWLIKSRLASTEQQGFKWMIGIILASVVLSGVILFLTLFEKTPQVIPYAQMTAEQRQLIPKKELRYIQKHYVNKTQP